MRDRERHISLLPSHSLVITIGKVTIFCHNRCSYICRLQRILSYYNYIRANGLQLVVVVVVFGDSGELVVSK